MKAKWELNNNHWALGENMGIHLGTQFFQRIPFISPHPFPEKEKKKLSLLGAFCLTSLAGKDF
jgi:hypothetical protein